MKGTDLATKYKDQALLTKVPQLIKLNEAIAEQKDSQVLKEFKTELME